MQVLYALGILALLTGLVLVVANRAVGWGLKQGYTVTTSVLFSTVVLMGLYALVVILARFLFQQDLIGIWQNEFEASLQATRTSYLNLGLEQTEVERSVRFIRLLFIQGALGWVMVMTMGLSLLSYLIQRRIAVRSGGSHLPLPAFVCWQMKEHGIWILLGAMILALIGSRGVTWAAWLSLNSLIVLVSIYFTIGMAIILFFLVRRNTPRFFRILIVALIALFPGLAILIALIGVLDTWCDWRKLRTASLPPE